MLGWLFGYCFVFVLFDLCLLVFWFLGKMLIVVYFILFVIVWLLSLLFVVVYCQMLI